MNHIKPNRGSKIVHQVTPQSAGWKYLDFSVISLAAGEIYTAETGTNEVGLIPLRGKAQARVTAQGHVADETFALARSDVFREAGQALYVPPRRTITLNADTAFEFAIGGAPAEGKYPTRLFSPSEMRHEARGGGAARRQVIHTLSYPSPAKRLILFEVWVPGGMWAGIPPHCHDGYAGSPYLEETYYYRIDPPAEGFAIHRNYRIEPPFDETFTVRDDDLVLVPFGFHPVAVPPGSNVYFVNYLAGDLVDEERKAPMYDDPNFVWIKENWATEPSSLPMLKF